MTGDVLVLGGGVAGLTTAVELAERGHRVTVWSRDAAEATTSAVAGALWWPYRIEPEERIGPWALASLRVYGRLAGEGPPDGGDSGVRLVEGVHAGVSLDGLGPWGRAVEGLRAVGAGEVPGGFATGLRARLPLVDMPVHLRWLQGRLRAAGGAVERRTAGGLARAAADAGASAVVNCTGLGSRELVPDASLRPVRGQLVVVENPGVTEWFTAADPAGEETTYLLPHGDRLLLGGTAQEGGTSTEPDGPTAAAIVRRCARIRPEVARARVLGHRVGLRPCRAEGVRLEAEALPDGRPLVHNYGHGGAGVTVAWGCARTAADLVEAAVG
ncbi:NAD(P)/FAD-dependent oxidoreductase [Streptomyces sp. C10-9-1]|uniref:NAD(P)/FAD-dependent oxidoreductase n=1 Tax=Streptomyces sp. C10-9-1 TaxID=1859285 RepID=UPI003F49C499